MGLSSQGTGMYKVKYLASILIVALSIIFVTCAPDISGGGSEAGNARISGMVTDTEGKPVADVSVLIVSSDYDPVKNVKPPSSAFDTTGVDGTYHFIVADSGVYSIQAVQEINRTRALSFYTAGHGDTTVPPCKLEKSGTIMVTIPSGSDTVNGYIYIPGTTNYVSLEHIRSSVFLDSVPAGTIPSIMYATKNKGDILVIKTNIDVIPNDTVSIILPEWRYSRQLILNTSSTGADVQENIYNFPLLVRLTTLNFDFDQAKSEGDDLRFSKSDGTILPYEIEQWNRTDRIAVLWVKIDTVFGNDSTQSITMFWGNESTVRYSGNTQVFDTANGFQGVWHLNRMSGDTFTDASQNRYFGLSPDSSLPSIIDGAIGKCCSFDGVDDFVTMPNTATGKLNFAQNGQFSVSAWVMADTLTDMQQTLVSKDKFQYFLWVDSTTWQFWEFQDRSGWIASEHPAQSKQWVFLTGICDGTMQQLYVNGVPTDNHSLKADNSARNTTSDLILGRAHEITLSLIEQPGFRHYRGSLDEVRITSTVQSAAWVRLCYMNQRSDDRLVIFKNIK